MSIWNWYRLKRLFGIEDTFSDLTFPAPVKHVQTQFSATVFTGEAQEWIEYLELPRNERYSNVSLRIFWDSQAEILELQAADEASAELANILNQGLKVVQEQVRSKPHVEEAFHRLVFENQSNSIEPFRLRVSPKLPSEATREVSVDEKLRSTGTNIVLQSNFVETTLQEIRQRSDLLSPEVVLGLTWPLLNRVISQLGYPNYPRDRFLERIELTTSMALLTINLFYDRKSRGRIVPNESGQIMQRSAAQRAGIPEKLLSEEHPYLRLLNELGFMLDERMYRGREELARVLVREYLDERYLRLSIAGVMPEVPEVMTPMPFRRRGSWISTPLPRLQQFGILNGDDFSAWKTVEDPIRDLGFVPLRQLGIGQFGRVYDVLNVNNPGLPLRLALKVDRVGQESNNILDSRATLQLSRDLAESPHVIRIYDAGSLGRNQLTYHLLQFIDGDTFDNLVGVTGREHSSITRPLIPRNSEHDVEELYLDSLQRSGGEEWRRRLVHPFVDPLTLVQVLDLMTSILLWVEKIHQLGYAVNDLKGGNIMISRRGQLKGIDMDSYSRVQSTYDLMADFFFLAVTLWLFLRYLRGKKWRMRAKDDRTIRDPETIRQKLINHWPFGDVEAISRGRVTRDELLDFFVDLISRCRGSTYAYEPTLFTEDINRLINLKRRVFVEEIVLD